MLKSYETGCASEQIYNLIKEQCQSKEKRNGKDHNYENIALKLFIASHALFFL